MQLPLLARHGRIIPRRIVPLMRTPGYRLYGQSGRAPALSVLFQDIEPPVINGVRKPSKPGGKYTGKT
jgi:hypothetical protein